MYRRTNQTRIQNIQSVYLKFVQIKILEQTLHGGESSFIFLLIQTGIRLAAASLYGMMKLHSVLPLGFYMLFPFAAFAVLGISQQLLPVVVSVHVNSKRILKRWTKKLDGSQGHWEDKHLRRQFQALRPLTIVAGLNGFVFFVLDQKMKSQFVTSILDDTINLLISLPQLD